jgi:polyribonucleotide nucleotidyltransferase
MWSEGILVAYCRVETQIGQQTLSLETGKLAKQAHGAVVVGLGDTLSLVAAV